MIRLITLFLILDRARSHCPLDFMVHCLNESNFCNALKIMLVTQNVLRGDTASCRHLNMTRIEMCKPDNCLKKIKTVCQYKESEFPHCFIAVLFLVLFLVIFFTLLENKLKKIGSTVKEKKSIYIVRRS